MTSSTTPSSPERVETGDEAAGRVVTDAVLDQVRRPGARSRRRSPLTPAGELQPDTDVAGTHAPSGGARCGRQVHVLLRGQLATGTREHHQAFQQRVDLVLRHPVPGSPIARSSAGSGAGVASNAASALCGADHGQRRSPPARARRRPSQPLARVEGSRSIRLQLAERRTTRPKRARDQGRPGQREPVLQPQLRESVGGLERVDGAPEVLGTISQYETASRIATKTTKMPP